MHGTAAQPEMPLPGRIQRAAHVEDIYRFWMTRIWRRKVGGHYLLDPLLIWIMLNPSHANGEKDDPTTKRVIQFTKFWGYAGAIIVNLYPIQTAHPDVCKQWSEGDGDGAHELKAVLAQNLDVIRRYVSEGHHIVVAWGDHPWSDDWAEHVVSEIGVLRPKARLFCLGLTARGAPKHPLARGKHRVPNHQHLILWRDLRWNHRAHA